MPTALRFVVILCSSMIVLVLPDIIGAEIFRWRDVNGTLVFSNTPRWVTSESQKKIVHKNSHKNFHKNFHKKQRMTRLFDGDTFKIETGELVRVVGIDCSEIGKRGFPDEPLAREAMLLTKRLLEQGEGAVTLTPDHETRDRFGRLLAYVELADGRDLGSMLLELGLAMVYIHPPNLDRTHDYLEKERQARIKKLGLWSQKTTRSINHQKAAQHVGGYRLVTGKVLFAKRARQSLYLNFGKNFKTDFTVRIKQKYWRAFRHANIDPERDYLQKIITVRGRIRNNNGPMIHVRHPLQIMR